MIRKVSSMGARKSAVLSASIRVNSGVLCCKSSSKMLILRPWRFQSSSKNLPWSLVGASLAVAAAQAGIAMQADSEEAPTAVYVAPSQEVVEPKLSFLQQTEKDLKAAMKVLSAKMSRIWKMLSRFASLCWKFAPVLSAVPIVALFDYDNFVDTHKCVNYWWWQWLRSSVRSAGPCTIKLCQWIATRPDLFPFTICRHLQELQIDATPPEGAEWYDAENAIEDAVGPGWKKKFDIDPRNNKSMLGSGCIAQVLKGKVIATGQPIAVKIIHNEVAETIATDIDIMKYLTSWVEMIPGINNLSLTESVSEFSTLMLSQLDLRREAKALERFRENFYCDSEDTVQCHSNKVLVTFPKPLPGLAFESVLFETFEEGDVISEYLEGGSLFPGKTTTRVVKGEKQFVGDEATRQVLAQAGLDCMLKMIFEDNFIHADLHMGNIIVKNMRSENQEGDVFNTKILGEGLTVSMIDAGLIAELNTEDRRNFLDLFAAIIKNDGREVGRLMIERNCERDNTMTYIQAERFQDNLEEVVSTVHKSGMALGRMSLGDLLQKVLVNCYQNNVKLDSKFVSVMLAIGIVEGMGRRLNPDIDILKAAAPHILKASAKFAAFYAAQKLHSAQMEHRTRQPVTFTDFFNNLRDNWDEAMESFR